MCFVRRDGVVKRARGKAWSSRSRCTSTFLTPIVRSVSARKGQGMKTRQGAVE